MQTETVEIEVYDKRAKASQTLSVLQLATHIYMMLENDIFNCDLTLGTEFETKINGEGKHEIIKIVKKSEYLTRRFLINSQFKESEYRLLGDEIIKQDGFWQVDFGGLATINLPKDCKVDIDEVFRIFNFSPLEIKD